MKGNGHGDRCPSSFLVPRTVTSTVDQDARRGLLRAGLPAKPETVGWSYAPQVFQGSAPRRLIQGNSCTLLAMPELDEPPPGPGVPGVMVTPSAGGAAPL